MSADLLWLLWMISWQATVLAGIVWLITRAAKNAPASWRHALWVVVLVKFLVPPFVYVPEQMAFWQKPESAITRPNSSANASPTVELLTPSGDESSEPTVSVPLAGESLTPPPAANEYGALAVLWAMCCAVMLLRLIARVLRQRDIVRRSVPARPELVALLNDCATRMGVGRVPDIRSCDLIPTPMLVGLFRPVILLPSDISRSCSPSDRAAMLMHELAHLKRLDMAVLWLYHLVCIFFPFHPALWFVGRQIRRERELACDEFVLSRSAISSQDYAAGYVSALKLATGVQTPSTALAMAEPASMEQWRLEMILRNAVPKLSRRCMVVIAVTAAVGLPTFVGTQAMVANRASAAPTIEEITAAMRGQEEARGESLEVNYFRTLSLDGKSELGEDGQPRKRTMRYVWTPTGIRMQLGSGENWENWSSVYSVIDGRMRSVDKEPDGTLKGKMVTSWSEDWCDEGLMETTAAGLNGRPLYVQIQNGQVSDEQESVDGHACWKVVVAHIDRSVNGVPLEGYELTVWCDPEIGYAPRRITSKLGEGESASVRDITFTDYKKVRPGFWFPMKMEKTDQGPRRAEAISGYSVHDVQAGKPIPRDELQVKLPANTVVIDSSM